MSSFQFKIVRYVKREDGISSSWERINEKKIGQVKGQILDLGDEGLNQLSYVYLKD